VPISAKEAQKREINKVKDKFYVLSSDEPILPKQ
jgi:hypothetical protein